ncbi:MAG: GntR family transcriptional regulator [Eubacterium sp.]
MTEYTKYLEISDTIKQKIVGNIYHANELLPSEKQLSLEYNVSRRTIRHSILKLVEDGYLYTVPGKGTFVHVRVSNKYKISLDLKDLIPKGYDKATLYSAKIQNPDIYQVYHLQVAPNEKVLCIRWILERDEKIIAYDIKTIPYFPGIPIGESELGYMTLSEILIPKFSQFEMKEEIVFTSITPDTDICDIMNLNADLCEPLVSMDTKVYDSDMMPLGWDKLYIRAEECEINGRLVY